MTPTPPPESHHPSADRTPSPVLAPPAKPDPAAGAHARALHVGRLALGLVTLLLLGLLVRVYQLQAAPSDNVAALVDSQIGTRTLEARRGAITDRRHRALATTRVAHLLFLDPDIVEDPNTFSERVGYGLGYEPAEIEMAMARRRGSRYIVIDPHMSEERWAKYQAFPPVRGLATHPVLIRDYPQGHVAGQLVGFVGHERKGLDGLERAFDQRLTPDPGQHAFVYDRGRRRLWLANKDYRLQADAAPVRLSIDLNLQAIAEDEVAAAVAKFGAKSGQGVVMDPFTGEILALANVPLFDPDDFRKLKSDPAVADAQRNRAATDIFEPGSIFKPLVWAAAVEAGMADPAELIDCTEEGHWKPERGPRLRDSDPHGVLSWADVLKFSSNIGMAKVAERMGKPMLHAVVKSYGFGQPTDSGLPGEVGGILRSLGNWSWADLSRVPMGHGVSVTGIQIARAFSALANGGVLINPTIHYRDGVTSRDALGPSGLIDLHANITARVLSPRVARLTCEVLGRAVSEKDGTGRHAHSDLYRIFGKTGTAQLPKEDGRGYEDGRYVSSFVAAAPLDRPRLVVAVIVHDPDKKKGYYGGTVSGPASKRILERSLQYLGVEPDRVADSADAIAQR